MAKQNSNRIALLRDERGWSQKDLAEAAFFDQRSISNYECDRHVTLSACLRLADLFDVSVDYLLGRSDIRKPERQTEDDVGVQIVALLDKFSAEEKFSLLKHLEFELSMR